MRRFEFMPGLWRSPLPLAREVIDFASQGGRTVVDLTQRPRQAVERACERAGIAYRKSPVDYHGHGLDAAVKTIVGAERPVLIHCFHGRDRTGMCVRRLRMRAGRVVLHRVGRNLNRAYRTCEALGVGKIALHQCNGRVSGQLYAAAGGVEVSEIESLPTGPSVLALETGAGDPLLRVEWETVDTIVIGGETAGLPRSLPVRYAHIEMPGRSSGLTVEAALAIALHAWRG